MQCKVIDEPWVQGKFQKKIVNTRYIKFFKNKSNRQKRRSVDLDEEFIVKTNSTKVYAPSAELHFSLILCWNHNDMKNSKALLAASLNRSYWKV